MAKVLGEAPVVALVDVERAGFPARRAARGGLVLEVSALGGWA